jgi:hypothetical protein
MVDTYRSSSLSREEKIEAQRQEDENLQIEEQAVEEEEAYQRELEKNQRMIMARRQEQNRENGETKKEVRLFQYSAPLIIAIFKDLLDIIGIGSLPAVGTVITLCLSFIIGILLFFFTDAGDINGKRKIAKRAAVFIVGLVSEMILFGANLLPIETLTVYIIYWMDKSDLMNSQLAKKVAKK